MRTITKIVFVLSVLLITGCMSVSLSTIKSSYPSIPETSKTVDIPKYDNTEHGLYGYPYVYWNFCKQKQNQLGLTSPELSSDSLIFRIWVTTPVGRKGQPHGLIAIKNDSGKWSGTLTFMYVDFNSSKLTETITKSKTIELTPQKANWETIADSLFKFKIDILSTDEKIPDYYTENTRYNNNAPTFSFEYATVDLYRFYQYSNIYRAPDGFWQVENVIRLLDMLEGEFQWDSLATEYFK